MGGMGSGLSGGRPTVEGSCKLDINRLLRIGALRPGEDHSCSTSWTNGYSDAIVTEAALQARMADLDNATLRLLHRPKGGGRLDGGKGELVDYVVHLTWTEQPFGGRRWWFRCPLSGQRVGTLLLPYGARYFASRERYRLGYQSQRSAPRDKAIARCHKIRRKLGAGPSPLAPVEKPLRMRWATFDREMVKLAAAERTSIAFAIPMVEALSRRIGRTSGIGR